jgi:hypothetical protein
MPLTFRDRGTSATRFDICSAEAALGTLWKEVLAMTVSAEGRWTWTWHAGPAAGPDKHGTAATIEAAQAQIQEQWTAWLRSAGLKEAD